MAVKKYQHIATITASDVKTFNDEVIRVTEREQLRGREVEQSFQMAYDHHEKEMVHACYIRSYTYEKTE